VSAVGAREADHSALERWVGSGHAGGVNCERFWHRWVARESALEQLADA
jgi:hypothetical protein